jgi:hypothetical protein
MNIQDARTKIESFNNELRERFEKNYPNSCVLEQFTKSKETLKIITQYLKELTKKNNELRKHPDDYNDFAIVSPYDVKAFIEHLRNTRPELCDEFELNVLKTQVSYCVGALTREMLKEKVYDSKTNSQLLDLLDFNRLLNNIE